MAQFLASSVPTDRQVVEIQIKGSTRNYLVAAHKYNQDTVSVGIDITERIQAEEALKAQSKYQVFYDRTGESLRMTGVTSDISAHKLAETQIIESLQEKEVLLQEIHHRLKNNLQVISSLLNLQSQQIDDSAKMEVFWESCNRVKSMALVHEQLYQSKDCARINCSEYIPNLTNCLFRAYGVNADQVNL
jgi:two-component sensor histidine kinase